MTRYLIVIVLVGSFSLPAAPPVANTIVLLLTTLNVAPSYAQTTVRKGKRVFVTRPTANVDMAIICKPEAAWR